MRELLTMPSETIEADFAALQSVTAYSPVFHNRREPDATVYWSDVPIPACNVITNARLSRHETSERAAQLLAPFFGRGLPFQWLTTPSTTSPALEAALAQAGLVAQESPAMHASLSEAVDPHMPADVVVDVAWPDQVAAVSSTIFSGFGFPPGAEDLHQKFLESLDPVDTDFFVARSLADGTCLSAGTLHHRGDSVMLANVTTLPSARRRGIGHALAATMLNRARATGSVSATVMATDGSYPVCLDLGFRTHFKLVTWVWDPRA